LSMLDIHTIRTRITESHPVSRTSF